MATAATNEAESITKCPICFETYNSPKYLPCLHTLCEACLSQYITSVFEANKSVSKQQSFPCPICRRDVPLPDPHLSPEDIAAKLPGNHFMVTLLDQIRLKSKDKLCDPCLVLKKHKKAESWCTVCNEALCTKCHQYHKAIKVLQNHKICSLEEIQSETKTITTLESCTQHEEEKVKLYCMDHQQPCCPICVTVHHRKCDHVKTLNDAAKGIRDSHEIQELTKSLKTMKDELSAVLKGRKSNLQQLKKGKQQYQDKITKIRQDINKYLDLLDEQVSQELDGRYKEASTLIDNDIDDIESSLKAISHYQSVIDAIVKNVSNVHMFLEINRIKQQHRERTELLKKRLEEMKHHEVELRFEDDWVNLSTNLTKVGTVTSSSTQVDVRPGILGGEGKADLRNFTARKTCKFSTGELLTDGIFLPNDQVLLVDCRGRKVMFCNLNGRVHKQLSLSGFPWTIVQLDDREAAVVLCNTRYIQLIDLVNCTLGKLITVNKTLYRAIRYNGTHLIVGGSDDNIYMIDRTGNIIKTIASGYRADYITCTTDRIYLTLGGNEMVCLDMNGSQIFSYTKSDFRYEQGISVDREGNIYCCGCWSHNIHKLTPDGQFIKLLVTDIKYPHGLGFDKTGERFLVTHDDNNVTVYELQQSV